MSAVVEVLPLTETRSPENQGDVAALLSCAFADGMAVYPIGGGTSLEYGSSPGRSGVGLSLARLKRIVDYPARDMTITVEAGLTMADLSQTLAAERQWLPIDVPQPEQATIGGVMSTAFSGPRRYGYGTMRDYVIGVTAVDGRGRMFHAGGRVVKNVAGYDFCKLLTGSLGTLGVITQISLKIKPRPERSAFLVTEIHDLNTAERMLAALVTSAATPAAIELLLGPAGRESAVLGLLAAGSIGRLVVGLEGTSDEVGWMLDQLSREWRALGVTVDRAICDHEAAQLWTDLAAFPAVRAPLVIKASLLSSRVTSFIALAREIDPQASIQAHAGNGIVIARFSKFDAADLSRTLIGRLQPAAELVGGSVVVLSSTLEGLTRQAIWGGATEATPWMVKVKKQFDPRGILNPGRFVHPDD